MSDKKQPLSVAIITKNEENRLPACLESIRFAEDIVVVDSGSTDRTLEIAERFGCRVFSEKWKGFGPQKQSAIEKCKNHYVLLLDSDERVSKEAAQKIKELFNGAMADAYSFRRKSYIGNRWIKHCGWWPGRVVRLFDRKKAKVEGAIHERVVITGGVVELDAVIEHFSFSDYSQMLKKLDFYTTCSAEELYGRNAKVNIFTPFFHSLWMFIRTYFIKRGFMDGFDGLVVSFLSAAGSFLKYAKLLEMKNRIK